MSPLVKFTYYVSVLFFLGSLFFTYYQFPAAVAIGYSDNVGMNVFKPKTELFYIGAGVFFLFNILVLVLKKMVPALPFSLFAFPNKTFWLADREARAAFLKVLDVWFDSFGILLNLLGGYVLMALFFVDVVEFKNFGFYVPVIYLFMFLLAFWWLVLVARLGYKKYEL